MRGKSPSSEHVLEKIKSKNSFEFSKGFEKGDNFRGFFSKYHFVILVHVYFNKEGQKLFKIILFFDNFTIKFIDLLQQYLIY